MEVPTIDIIALEGIKPKITVIMTFLRGSIIYKLGSFPEERTGIYIHEREAIGVN